jgi:hypothetical protein
MSFVTSKRSAAEQGDTRNEGVKPQRVHTRNTVAAPMSHVLTRRTERHETPNRNSLAAGRDVPRGTTARAHPIMNHHAHRATTQHRELMEIVGTEGELYTSDAESVLQPADTTPMPGLGVWSALVLTFVLALACRRLRKTKHTAHHDTVLPLH